MFGVPLTAVGGCRIEFDPILGVPPMVVGGCRIQFNPTLGVPPTVVGGCGIEFDPTLGANDSSKVRRARAQVQLRGSGFVIRSAGPCSAVFEPGCLFN